MCVHIIAELIKGQNNKQKGKRNKQTILFTITHSLKLVLLSVHYKRIYTDNRYYRQQKNSWNYQPGYYADIIDVIRRRKTYKQAETIVGFNNLLSTKCGYFRKQICS